MVDAPHPESVLITESGGRVELKVHQCVWSGDYPGNSLPAVLECYRAHVARAEVDVAMLADADFLVVHDLDLARATDGAGLAAHTARGDAARLHLRHHGVLTTTPVVLLSELVCAIAAEPYPTLLELDLKDWTWWPRPRVEELASLLQPVKDRITFGGDADWNLRRLHQVDPSLHMGFTISHRLEVPTPQSDELREWLNDMVGRVPTARDIHVRLDTAWRMWDPGRVDLADLLHARGMLLDLWTLNAGFSGWREALNKALQLGPDVITTETPRALAEAVRSA